ncbi:DUF4199 domain-containing protein [uncultured Prevotella sp.]|uniref:DUF4199 domain-containing protein n=1 Tax=uncultured Prevotella sp. TaxID=159272 RepID=UPI0025EEF917|nr:DUF4199 domain-containing protein [uncultured Prevotella sp.]
MTTREEYEQIKAFARIDGAIMGVMWIISFACFIAQFYMPLLNMAALIFGIASIIVSAIRLRNFRDNILDGMISYWRAYGYSLLTYFYAALLLAAAQYIYFQFIDHGFLLNQYTAMTSSPEFKSMMTLYGIKADEMKLTMDTIATLRPIDIALQFLTTNLFFGIVISWPMAALIKSKYKRKF